MPFFPQAVLGTANILARWASAIPHLVIYSLSWRNFSAQNTDVAEQLADRKDVLAEILDARLDNIRAVAAIQARAADRIDAAEYAFNRLLEDCSAIMTLPLARLPQPAAEPALLPAAPAMPRPLAA